MCFDGDSATVWKEVDRVARKRYKCDECGAPIPIGVKYTSIGMLAEDEWSRLRVHVECLLVWRLVRDLVCDGVGLIMIGGLDQELREADAEHGKYIEAEDRFTTPFMDVLREIRATYEAAP
jgi:hypothetical protein